MASRTFLYDAPAQGLRRLPFWAMPISMLLMSCASTAPVTKNPPASEHIVEGAGTEDERAVIEKTNDQILQAQRATGIEQPGSDANQGLP